MQLYAEHVTTRDGALAFPQLYVAATSSTEVKLTRRVDSLTPLTELGDWVWLVACDVTSVLPSHHCKVSWGWEVTLQVTLTDCPLVRGRTFLVNVITGRRTEGILNIHSQNLVMAGSLGQTRQLLSAIPTPDATFPSAYHIWEVELASSPRLDWPSLQPYRSILRQGPLEDPFHEFAVTRMYRATMGTGNQLTRTVFRSSLPSKV